MSKKTTKAIVVGGNDYVIQVKGNQPKLKASIVEYEKENEADDSHYAQTSTRGRIEKRQTMVYYGVKGNEFEKWPGLTSIIVVRRSGLRKGKKYDEKSYYISSRKVTSAQEYAKRIRQHWEIENNLHWVKDAILREDKSLVNGKQLAENLSILRTLVMNTYRLNNYLSIKKAIEKYSNRIYECILFIYV